MQLPYRRRKIGRKRIIRGGEYEKEEKREKIDWKRS
jgi:hypothetical protein